MTPKRLSAACIGPDEGRFREATAWSAERWPRPNDSARMLRYRVPCRRVRVQAWRQATLSEGDRHSTKSIDFVASSNGALDSGRRQRRRGAHGGDGMRGRRARPRTCELAGRADPSLDAPLESMLGDADVVVDFTTPAAALENVRACLEADVHAVVGTTGFDLGRARDGGRGGRRSAVGGARVFAAPNFAIGAVLMMQMARQAAPHMPECEIVELHHAAKLDAPSGTAKRTAALIREAGGDVHEPIHSIRLPGLVAHQEVIFGGEGQTLSIRHDSTDRRSFMPGVLLAVRSVGGLADPLTVGLEHLL